MTEKQLVDEIIAEITKSCALPYALPEPEVKRIINRAKAYMFDNYQYAVEDKIFHLPIDIFKHPEFIKTRQILMPDCVVGVYDVRELNGVGTFGQIDRDFSDSKLLGAEIFLSPFQGDNLLYRTVMYSYFDLARAFLLETVAYSFNKNTKRLTITGRNPRVGVGVRAGVKIPDETLFDDELFVRYCLAQAKINLGRMLGVFQYNLPGGVSINFDSIKSDGKEELEAILKQIDDENTPSYFIQFN
jgi:hypothetical protein